MKQLLALENDTAFHELNQKVNSLNILKTLGLEHYEIRHSNFLAWLLNPQETHHLNDYFLRKMLEHIILMEENDQKQKLTYIESLLDHRFLDSYVFRELKTDQNRYIDLVVVNHTLKTVIIIENKFYASESKNQLNDYLDFAQEHFHDFHIIPIYLTLDGERPSNEQYFIFTYERITQILRHMMTLFQHQLDQKAYYFIKDYYYLLRERFYPSERLTIQAINLYQAHRETIDRLFNQASHYNKQLSLKPTFEFNFIQQYNHTIEYIYNHGKNIFSYSFEAFIEEQFNHEVMFKLHPTTPGLIPPEWNHLDQYRLKDPSYWLGVGIIVWFERTKQNRLKLIAEIGPLEHQDRLTILHALEAIGCSIKDESKLASSRYTRFFSEQIDMNKWDDIEELSQAMGELYHSPSFTAIRKNLAAQTESKTNKPFIQKKESENHDPKRSEIIEAFKQVMASYHLNENFYRITSRNLSFKLPLFDLFKEKLGETREKWWWDNGPFLCWMEYDHEKIYFTLEVGPIDVTKRIELMNYLAEKHISFRKSGLEPEAKYTRIHSETKRIAETHEPFEQIFNDLFKHPTLKEILIKLEEIYHAYYELD